MADSPRSDHDESNLLVRRLCGGRLTEHPVTFTKDSKYFFCCSYVDIKVFSVETGKLVRTLSGHNKLVTSTQLNPKNPLQLLSSSLDGTVKVWDFNDSVLLKSYDLHVPVVKMVVHPEQNLVYVLAKPENSTKREKRYRLYSYSLSGQGQLKLLSENWKCDDISASQTGNILAGVYENNLVVYTIKDNKLEAQREYKHTCLLVNVCFHPGGELIATGDQEGAIIYWYCLGENAKRQIPITAHKHWHSHATMALTFSEEGTYMLSGGEEAVLVIWQIKTGNKQFLPRLASSIVGITVSPDQLLYAICHGDGSVRIISATTLQTLQVTNGLKYPEHTISPRTLGKFLIMEPKNGHAVLTGGLPGSIQFYNLKTDQKVSEIEIVHQNRISRIDDEKQNFTRVTFVAFSSDGDWMATVDRREPKGDSLEEISLKFWKYDAVTQKYDLNTRVESPHKKEISALTFQPGKRGDVVATASFDGRFKIWTRTDGIKHRGTEGETSSWSCKATGFYRASTPHDAVFSDDGSILAVSYGQVITLWDPRDNTLKTTLYHPTPFLPILKMQFIHETPYLVSYTAEYLYVWNLLTCSVWWSQKLKVSCMGIEKKKKKFVVCDTSNLKRARLLFFSPESPIPYYIYNHISAGCRSITFVDDGIEGENKDLTSILVLNVKNFLEYFTPKEKMNSDVPIPEKENMTNHTNISTFNDIFADSQVEGKSAPEKKWQLDKKERVSEIISAPAHVIPSVNKIYFPYMDALLIRAKNQKQETKEMEKIEAVPTILPEKSQFEDLEGKEEDRHQEKEKGQEKENQKPANVEVKIKTSDFDFLINFFAKEWISGHNTNGTEDKENDMEEKDREKEKEKGKQKEKENKEKEREKTKDKEKEKEKEQEKPKEKEKEVREKEKIELKTPKTPKTPKEEERSEKKKEKLKRKIEEEEEEEDEDEDEETKEKEREREKEKEEKLEKSEKKAKKGKRPGSQW